MFLGEPLCGLKEGVKICLRALQVYRRAMSGTPNNTPLATVFQSKYSEFCEDLGAACPEFGSCLNEAYLLGPEERLGRFVDEVLPHCGPDRDPAACPGKVLPGVVMTPAIWNALSENNKKAIQGHLNILSMCALYDSAREHIFNNDGTKTPFAKEWTQTFMKDWQSKMGSTDFEEISKKLGDFFKDPSALPTFPEHLMNGHIARLAKEIVSELDPKEFGFDEETMKNIQSVEGAFQAMMSIYSRDPTKIMASVQRVVKRLASKFQNGQIRPDQIAQEAEELMKAMSDNPAMVELMESFRGMFGMMDMDTAKAVGREGEARRNIVRDRLRKKLEAKKAAGKS